MGKAIKSDNEKNGDSDQNIKPIREGTSNQADFHHGSTTQGGSNFGQGSHQLGRDGEKQGSESNGGANYDGEEGWNNESLRTDDIDPDHG